MSDTAFAELEQARSGEGPRAAIDRLVETLRNRREYRRLFDALLLKKRYEMGLPLAQPTSLDVPEEQRGEFEQAFVDAAREVGELLLETGNIPQAWGFLNMIREPAKVAEAIERLDVRADAGETTQQIIQIALYEGANPVKGLEILLRTHGTCNTITTLDQMMSQLSPENQRKAAALLVRQLYEELSHSLRADVERRIAMLPPTSSLRELFTGREWLFADGNYHIDVSHLNAVVRFARVLAPDSPELPKALELAEYGSRLDRQFQYAGDPPFDDFYPAHEQFFKVLLDRNRADALAYFREKLAAEPDEEDKPYLAIVLVDLLIRIGRLDEALELAETYLSDLDESSGFSFAELCQEAGNMEALKRTARSKGDLVAFTAAIVQDGAGQ
ncbi:MAG: hypothetical protein KY476_19105 [Planctomycetes bacterium]|nr:hypothetical protein [Planctomycetota bacterium]